MNFVSLALVDYEQIKKNVISLRNVGWETDLAVKTGKWRPFILARNLNVFVWTNFPLEKVDPARAMTFQDTLMVVCFPQSDLRFAGNRF